MLRVPHRRIGRAVYWLWLLVALVVVATAWSSPATLLGFDLD
jgi:uncharacterized membrane protein YhaH (DUF805 family)